MRSECSILQISSQIQSRKKWSTIKQRNFDMPDKYHKWMSRKILPELCAKLHYNQQLSLMACYFHFLSFYAKVL